MAEEACVSVCVRLGVWVCVLVTNCASSFSGDLHLREISISTRCVGFQLLPLKLTITDKSHTTVEHFQSLKMV